MHAIHTGGFPEYSVGLWRHANIAVNLPVPLSPSGAMRLTPMHMHKFVQEVHKRGSFQRLYISKLSLQVVKKLYNIITTS